MRALLPEHTRRRFFPTSSRKEKRPGRVRLDVKNRKLTDISSPRRAARGYRAGPAGVPVLGRAAVPLLPHQSGTRPRAGASPGAAPGRSRRRSEQSSSRNPSSPHPDPPTSPLPRPGAPAGSSHVSQATPARCGSPPCRGRGATGTAAACCSGYENKQGFAPGRAAPCPAARGTPGLRASDGAGRGSPCLRSRVGSAPRPSGRSPAAGSSRPR